VQKNFYNISFPFVHKNNLYCGEGKTAGPPAVSCCTQTQYSVFFSAFVIINHSLGTVDISSATVQSVGILETGIQFQCPAELPAACGNGAPRWSLQRAGACAGTLDTRTGVGRRPAPCCCSRSCCSRNTSSGSGQTGGTSRGWSPDNRNVTYTSNIYWLPLNHFFISRTFNFVYFAGSTIHEFKIKTKYLFILVIFNIIWSSQIQVSTNMTVHCHQTFKFSAHEIQLLHSTLSNNKYIVSILH